MKRPRFLRNQNNNDDASCQKVAPILFELEIFHSIRNHSIISRRFCHRHRRCYFLHKICIMIILILFCVIKIPFAEATSSEIFSTSLTIEQVDDLNYRHQLKRDSNNRKQHWRRRFLADDEEEDQLPEVEESSPTISNWAEEKCIQVGQCKRCSSSEQQEYKACRDTGRWVKFECIMTTETDNNNFLLPRSTAAAEDEILSKISLSEKVDMRSCKYTEFDEEFTMIRLQIFCLLIGSLAIVSVKKQKRLSFSLFDQRKQQRANTTANNGKRSSDFVTEDDEEIEFTPMTNQLQKEKVPLMEISNNVHMEII